jgi:capsule biosynthesis phosphatase
MRFCIDIDGTITKTRKEGQEYGDIKPKHGAVNALKKLKEEGHYIILNTARNMETFSSNVGKVMAVQGPILFEWLKKYEIPYDEIYFGKPSADFYVDDKAIKLTKWKNFKWKQKEY